ncbi:4-demethylwyosine synthase TYW1 [Candidatus Micrarchaeota archaeon]|nr:4-demethylwyosine synthase TYW1 [Candidatus Micrarchaeota archaeon]MBU1930429.1 4-demethylwyosine synthase TYW1 [Candidatus Micrarchaeota archaeon]
MHRVKDFLPISTIELLQKQGYFLFGHAAVKTCHYTKQALRSKKSCYKQKFYGVQSHQCIQMSPASAFCDQKCVYCWRPTHTFIPVLKSQSPQVVGVDSPQEIVEESIRGQAIQLSGFGGFKDVNREKLAESKLPKHAALSLTGEPTLYPQLPELIQAYHQQGISTFLVSNGLHPEMLERLIKNPPTQLYLSVDSPKKEIHDSLNKPVFSDSWKKLNQSIELLSQFPSRTVIRITCVKGKNMQFPQEFAALIQKGNPDFVEIKGYVHIGFSQYRLPRNCMPSFKEVKAFAQEIAQHLGYHYKMDDKESLVCLLVRSDWKDKSTIIPFRKLFPKAFEEQDAHMQKWKERQAKTKK